jgi:hypothetical protein
MNTGLLASPCSHVVCRVTLTFLLAFTLKNVQKDVFNNVMYKLTNGDLYSL